MIKLQSTSLAFFAIICITTAQNYDVYLTAQLDAYCRMQATEHNEIVDYNAKILQDRVGKAGPRGPPGHVNYTLLREMINRKVAEKIDELKADLVNSVEDIKNTLKTLKEDNETQPESCDGVIYKKKCYLVIVQKMTLDKAKTLCRSFNGKMANIYSLQHYDKVMGYMSQHMDAQHFEILLGMSFNSTTSEVRLDDGRPAPYVNWLSGWPSLISIKTQMSVRVNNDASLSYKGMWNQENSYKFHGVLCEI
ncbi:uncharacterized protein LOC120339548 [Styela clava]|uniref:uncharacterized protein LOC120339548 n=1 Tax=Styela clava TaxID=7725 RepID=UPI0019399018|nr:uncharacterized protein LOC120339548 [Styela clava]